MCQQWEERRHKVFCAESWAVLGSMLGTVGTEKLTYDWKPQLSALSGRARDATGAALPDLACKQLVVDVRIAAWLIRPDSYETSDNPCPPLAVCCNSPFDVLGPLAAACAIRMEPLINDTMACLTSPQTALSHFLILAVQATPLPR